MQLRIREGRYVSRDALLDGTGFGRAPACVSGGGMSGRLSHSVTACGAQLHGAMAQA